MCGRYRLSRRKQIIEEHFDSVSGEKTGRRDTTWLPRSLRTSKSLAACTFSWMCSILTSHNNRAQVLWCCFRTERVMG